MVDDYPRESLSATTCFVRFCMGIAKSKKKKYNIGKRIFFATSHRQDVPHENRRYPDAKMDRKFDRTVSNRSSFGVLRRPIQNPTNETAQGNEGNNTDVNIDIDPEQGNEDDKSQADGEKEPEQRENGDQNGEVSIARTRIVYNYSDRNKVRKSGRTNEEEDAYVMSMRYVPTLDTSFEDNKFKLFFRYFVEGEIGFDYFEDISQLDAIEIADENTTISPTDNQTISLEGNENKRLVITLSSHDKQIIIDACAKLMEKGAVLVAEPFYHSIAVDCDVPNDPYYSDD